MGGDSKIEQIEIKRLSFLGLSISVFEKQDLINFIINTVSNNQHKIFYGHALWSFPMINKYPAIYKYGEKADVFVTDGRIFYLMAKWHGLLLKYEISIPNLVHLILELANKNNWSVYLLGATEETNQLAQLNIKNKYPSITKVTGRNGYFNQQEYDSIRSEVSTSRCNILLLGISSPIKEILAAEWKEQMNTNIIIPCGGMIDVLAGKTKQTPPMIKRFGLASFYRVLQEPKRLFKRYSYIYGFLLLRFIPVYFYQVIIRNKKDFSFIEHIGMSK